MRGACPLIFENLHVRKLRGLAAKVIRSGGHNKSRQRRWHRMESKVGRLNPSRNPFVARFILRPSWHNNGRSSFRFSTYHPPLRDRLDKWTLLPIPTLCLRAFAPPLWLHGLINELVARTRTTIVSSSLLSRRWLEMFSYSCENYEFLFLCTYCICISYRISCDGRF